MKVRASDYLLAALFFLAFAGAVTAFGLLPFGEGESPLTSLRRLGNVIVAHDQPPSGELVVAYVALAEPSFIVLTDEASGAILAVSRLLPEGEARGVAVAVPGGVRGGFIYAAVRRDDGDGQFEETKDAPARDAHGAAAITRILVTDGASR